MLTKMTFKEPAHSSFVPERRAGRPESHPDRYRTLEDGSVVEIPERKPHESAIHTTLEVREEDLPDLRSALSWFTGLDSIPQPKIVSRNGDRAEVQFLGEFIPKPSPDDIQQIIGDFRLLSSDYRSWSAVLRRSSKWGEPLDDQFLLSIGELLQGIKTTLQDLGSVEINKRVKQLPDLPKWALRVLQIRRERREKA